ncbi:OmpA family protein [Magnetospira sp. QH-2]|uniref:OmpA family protein n=1 Tax=Magnetospira sp. (strain QH-2) TaxID=1288970 RepID=UPI0003E81912|nr:OmpA family protein [Magnetospira sp. QH-2]CCQ73662.1 Conserved protein of unknown function. Containing OmpA/MotB domain [Magnetospira sp. QH-2]
MKSTAVLAMMVPLALGGCSTAWMDDYTPDWFDDEPTAEGDVEVVDAPGGDRDYPSVADTPEALQASAEAERAQVAEGLRADNIRNRYAADTISRQNDMTDDIPIARAPTSANAPMAAPPMPTVSAPMVAGAPVPMAPVPTAPSVPGAPQTASAQPAGPAQPVPPMPWLGPRPQPLQVVTSESQAGALLPSRPGSAAFATGIYDPTAAGPVVISGSGLQMPVTALPMDRRGTLTGADRRNIMPGNALRVATIQFQDGSSQLSAHDRTILRQVVALHRERGGVVRVVGHASSRTRDMDPVKHKMVNLSMSTARAERVAKALVSYGAPSSQVQTAGVSDHEPRFYEVMPAGEAGNRRTEIYFLR